MKEFSEDLKTEYNGTAALSKRVLYRTQFEKFVVPYSTYGVDYSLFQNPSAFEASLRKMLGDLDLDIQVDGGRLTTANITIDLETQQEL